MRASYAPPQVRIHGEGIATYPRGTGYGPRTLADFELMWIIHGTAIWCVEGQELTAPPGTVLLARPGMRDAFRWDRRRSTVHGYLHFALEGYPTAVHHWPLVRTLPDDDIFRPLVRHIGWLLGHAGTEHHVAQAVLLALEAFLSGRLGSTSAAEEDLPPAVRRMLEAIITAIERRERPQLDDLVRASGVSRSSLAVQATASLGCTPMDALRLLRLERACQLLSRTELPIQEIAALVGFDDAFHFSRVFRRSYGHAPRTFRQSARRGAIPPESLRMARRMAQLRP